MNFSWNEAQRQLYDKILGFARTELSGDPQQRDRQHSFSRELWDRAARMGLTGLCLPQAFGGLELGRLDTALGLEALGLGCPDTGFCFSVASHLFAGAIPIWKFGSPAVQARLCPALAEGRTIGANAVTEAGAGSDTSVMQARAQREERGYRLSGEKSFVTNGPVAGVFVVYAMTKPEHGHLGMSAFLVEAGTPGLTVGTAFDKIGLRTSPTSSLYLDDCLVPAENLLGEEGQGAAILRDSMAWERTCEFAIWVGSMQRQLERTVEYAKGRRQGRKTIASHQSVAHKIVDMGMRLEAARLLLYRACWMLDEGLPAEKDICMAKLAVSEASIKSSLDALQIHGANGVVTEYGIEQFLRDAVPSTITSGTSEIQRNIISTHFGL